MSKKLNTDAIANELAQTAFFRQHPPPVTQEETPPHRAKPSPAPRAEKLAVQEERDKAGEPRDFPPRETAHLSPTLPDSEKVEKYTTHLEPSLIKRIKLEAIEKDIKDYDVVRAALTHYFESNK